MKRSSVIWLIVTILLLAGAGGAVWLLREPLILAWRYVRPVNSTESVVRFAVVGDNHGVNPIYQQILEDISDQSFDFLLNLGDHTEHGTADELATVKALEQTLPFPVYHTVGSHDIKTDATRQTYINVFNQSPWYTVDVQQVHLIVLDNADRQVGFPAAELDWLAKDLADRADQISLVAFHRPFDLPLAALTGDDETSASRQTNNRLVNILRSGQVKYIFSAHLHTYLPFSIDGIPAVISGGGGDPAQFALGGASSNYFHYLDVTVRGSVITVTPIKISQRE